MAQEPNRSITQGNCVGTLNSNNKRYLRRIAKNTRSIIKCCGTENLMEEVDSISNSRPLIVETLSDINSQIPLSPSNLLTMKANVVMPPPVVFTKPGLYYIRSWRRVQNIAEEFCHRYRKTFLQSLQTRQKLNDKRSSFEVGHIERTRLST